MKSENQTASGKTPEAPDGKPGKEAQAVATSATGAAATPDGKQESAASPPPSSIADIEAYFLKLVAEKTGKGLPKNQAVKVATEQIKKDASCGVLDAGAVEKWLKETTHRGAGAATAPAESSPEADVEATFKNLVAEKMAKGLRREQAVEVATRQIQRDASTGKIDPATVKQWLVTVAQRTGSPLLGIR